MSQMYKVRCAQRGNLVEAGSIALFFERFRMIAPYDDQAGARRQPGEAENPSFGSLGSRANVLVVAEHVRRIVPLLETGQSLEIVPEGRLDLFRSFLRLRAHLVDVGP